jgi:hypothetical protein
MSLDVYLSKMMPTEVFTGNITHNLGKMADKVVLSNGQTLYQILWRPDECTPPYTKASEIAELDGIFYFRIPRNIRNTIQRMVGATMMVW